MTPQIKSYTRRKNPQESTKSSAPSAPRTRSQVAPNWTTSESLVLVNVIAAVGREYSRALSSHQKWKIVVQNCIAMDVGRPLTQCRRKWNSLLAEYNTIKQRNCNSGVDSYWSLPAERRVELGLPENLDQELFKSIDDYVKSQKDDLESDPDTDPEAEADLLDVIAKLGSKKQKRHLKPLEARAGEKFRKCRTAENPRMIYAGEEPPRSREEKKTLASGNYNNPIILIDDDPEETTVEDKSLQVSNSLKPQTIHAPRENREKTHVAEKPQASCVEGKSQSNHAQREKITSAKQNELMVAEKLAEKIHSIVQEKLPETAGFETADLGNNEDLQNDFVRRQGDKLIAHLEEMVNISKQFTCPEE